jgi:NAD kinase
MSKTIGIVANKRKPDITNLVEGLRSWLEARDVRVILWDDLRDMLTDGDFRPIDEVAEESDIVVALGGDGTLLRSISVASASSPRWPSRKSMRL